MIAATSAEKALVSPLSSNPVELMRLNSSTPHSNNCVSIILTKSASVSPTISAKASVAPFAKLIETASTNSLTV